MGSQCYFGYQTCLAPACVFTRAWSSAWSVPSEAHTSSTASQAACTEHVYREDLQDLVDTWCRTPSAAAQLLLSLPIGASMSVRMLLITPRRNHLQQHVFSA